MLSMKEAKENYVEGCVGKVECPVYKLFIKAILAGMMIAFGAAGSSVAAHDIANVGLARLVAGVVFPMGLMMVVMTGAELFTGDCLAIMATVQKKHTALKLIRMLVVVYLGNLLGSLLLTCIDYVSGQYNYSSGILGAYTIKVALGKCNLDFTTALASGVLCNILVCAAVMLAARAKDVTGKLLCCFFIILLFVVSGYEHCVANMYYVPAGMIAKLNPLYVKDAMEQYGYTAQQLSALNIPNFIFNNLIPVTIGNIVGGMAFFGIPLMRRPGPYARSHSRVLPLPSLAPRAPWRHAYAYRYSRLSRVLLPCFASSCSLQGDDAYKRFILILKWYLSSWHYKTHVASFIISDN